MQRLLYTFLILFLTFLFISVESKKACSTSTETKNASSSIRYKHGLFETRHLNLTGEQYNSSFRNSEIEWIRNVTYQSQFVAVTTYDRDVIISEFEYSPISGLRIVRVTPENEVVWNIPILCHLNHSSLLSTKN